MRKRKRSAILCLLLVCCLLAGCGTKSGSDVCEKNFITARSIDINEDISIRITGYRYEYTGTYSGLYIYADFINASCDCSISVTQLAIDREYSLTSSSSISLTAAEQTDIVIYGVSDEHIDRPEDIIDITLTIEQNGSSSDYMVSFMP